MCIICAMTDHDGMYAASEFLEEFERATKHMKAAEKAMLVVAKSVVHEDDKRKYKRFHKAMIKARKGWTALEQVRENYVHAWDGRHRSQSINKESSE